MGSQTRNLYINHEHNVAVTADSGERAYGDRNLLDCAKQIGTPFRIQAYIKEVKVSKGGIWRLGMRDGVELTKPSGRAAGAAVVDGREVSRTPSRSIGRLPASDGVGRLADNLTRASCK